MDRHSFQPENVLITRLSAIGDCITTIPLAVDVKRLWPECKITWIVDCGASALLERHSAVDRVIRITKKWLKHPKKWSEIRSQLRACKIDLALDAQGLTKSSMLGWLSGARVRIGFDRSHGRELAPWFSTDRVTRTHRHMVDTYRELLSPWQEPAAGTGEFQMPIYAAEAERMDKTLAALSLGPSWAAMNVGAGWSTKLWPAARFAETARGLFRRHRMKSIVMWAGDKELAVAEEVVSAAQGSAVLGPSTSLPELAELLRRADLMISSDTGPAHLCAAVGTPCVGLFGPTWGDECGPYGSIHRVVQSIVMPRLNKPQRKGHAEAMEAITVEEVLDACAEVLSSLEARRRAAAA